MLKIVLVDSSVLPAAVAVGVCRQASDFPGAVGLFRLPAASVFVVSSRTAWFPIPTGSLLFTPFSLLPCRCCSGGGISPLSSNVAWRDWVAPHGTDRQGGRERGREGPDRRPSREGAVATVCLCARTSHACTLY